MKKTSLLISLLLSLSLSVNTFAYDLENKDYDKQRLSFSEANINVNGTAISGVTIEDEEIINVINIGVNNNEKDTDSGGAMYINDSKASVINITNSRFNNNKTKNSQGGAIYNSFPDENENKKTLLTIKYSTFTGNIVGNDKNLNKDSCGGAIYTKVDLAVANSLFNLNQSTTTTNDKKALGGAIYVFGNANLTITDKTIFEENTSYDGGAIYSTTTYASGTSEKGLITILNSEFNSNIAVSSGGAIFAGENTVFKIIDKTKFEKNEACDGGAIFNKSTKENNIIANSNFTGNIAKGSGGAIYNEGNQVLKISESDFTGNTAAIDGGAIYNSATGNIELTDVSFKDNIAQGKGGAIYSDNSLTIIAQNKNIEFSGNLASGDGNDIYMATKDSELNLKVAKGQSIIIGSGISGVQDTTATESAPGYKIIVDTISVSPSSALSMVSGMPKTSDTEEQHDSLILKAGIKNAAITVKNGSFKIAEGGSLYNSDEIGHSTLTMEAGTTLNTANNKIEEFDKNITLNEGANLVIDIDLAKGKADNFESADKKGNITITDVNLIGTGNLMTNNLSLNIAELVGIDAQNLNFNLGSKTAKGKLLTPIRYLYLETIDSEGNMIYSPTGEKYKDFNPAVMAAPVAVNAGSYLTQLNSYEQAFRDLDMYLISNANPTAYYKAKTNHGKKGFWLNPYGNFENVYLNNGPRVENVSYGAFFGFESDLFDLGGGWDGIFNAYIAYNGTDQKYDAANDKITIKQQGGMVGLSLFGYKNNLFMGMTLNSGFNFAHSKTEYGEDDFQIMTGGIAGKIGWNWKLANGRLIFQPSFLVARSLINLFDYTTSANVHMTSDIFSAVQMEQTFKLIGNFNCGFQPYIMASSVWNNFESKFYASEDELSDVNIKSFVKYGLGARYIFNKDKAGYIQANCADGGKNGVDIQAGFSFKFGDNKKLKTDNIRNIENDLIRANSIIREDYDQTKVAKYKTTKGKLAAKSVNVGDQVKVVTYRKAAENKMAKDAETEDLVPVNVGEQIRATAYKKSAENKIAKTMNIPETSAQIIQLDDETKIVVYKKNTVPVVETLEPEEESLVRASKKRVVENENKLVKVEEQPVQVIELNRSEAVEVVPSTKTVQVQVSTTAAKDTKNVKADTNTNKAAAKSKKAVSKVKAKKTAVKK